jgi:hypothetical protein
MSGSFFLALTLGGAIALAAPSCCLAQGQPDGGPKATGSMYNGNNVQPPDLTANDPRLTIGENNPEQERQTPVGDAKGGDSDTARAGGGG